jgi:hypothetical protein
LKSVGVSCEYGEPIEKWEYRGSHSTVGDREHAEIIRLYVEEGLGMNKIADKLGRSSRVPFKHIFISITARLKALDSVQLAEE